MISFRRKLLNRELRMLEARFHGSVLDIGGKRGCYKGYSPPVGRCASWKYLNPDPDTTPDYAAGVEHIPLDSASLDVVLMLEVLEYLSEPSLAFAEIHRVLRPGGTCIFSSPLLFPIHGDKDLDRSRFSAVQITEMLSGHGLDVEDVRTIGSVGAVIHDVLFAATSYASPGYPHSLTLKALQRGLYIASPFFRLLDSMTRAQAQYLTTGYLVLCRKGLDT